MKKIPVFFVAVFLVLELFGLIAAPAVFAVDKPSQLVPCGGPGQHDCTICDFFEMTRRVSNYVLFWIIPVLTAFVLLVGGIYLVWSKGDPKTVVGARTAIKVAIYGFAGIFAGWVLVNTFFMALGVAEWNGVKMNESWWKISAKCSNSWETSADCGDGILQANEACDPEMTIEACQGRYGMSKEKCQLIKDNCKPKGDANECTAAYCGDGVKQSDEECDPNESVATCVARTKKDGTNLDSAKCKEFIDYCNKDCKKIAHDLCGESADKSKIGLGCWLSNDITNRELYCQRGKYICDDDPASPTYDKVVCKALEPKLMDECCFDRGDGLDTMSFDIVRIRDMVKLDTSATDPNQGLGGVFNTTGQAVACMSKSVDCDTVCREKDMVCIGVGLGDYKKNKCISVIHHEGNDCNLSENITSNDCRAKYCLTNAICCEGGTCEDYKKPCCDPAKHEIDPYHGLLTGTGAQFSVGETACYCK